MLGVILRNIPFAGTTISVTPTRKLKVESNVDLIQYFYYVVVVVVVVVVRWVCRYSYEGTLVKRRAERLETVGQRTSRLRSHQPYNHVR